MPKVRNQIESCRLAAARSDVEYLNDNRGMERNGEVFKMKLAGKA